MRVFLAAALAMLALDQMSKWLIVHRLGLKSVGAIDVLPPFLRLRMGWNEGINFGLFAGHPTATRWLLIVLAVVICAWVSRWALRDGRTLMLAFAGLLVGGALGNVIDRLLYGAVADFLNMSCCGIVNPYTFNIADVGIFVGAIGLVLFADRKKTP
jgi:signal peptidase II